jgi:predicted metal-dependent HD superfamily phosphohydrolase
VARTTPTRSTVVLSLKKRWADLAGPGAAAAGLADNLLNRWSEPHRRYHTPEHLVAVLDRLDQLGGASEAVMLAGWYHDAVYDPTRDDNEAASAELAVLTLAVASVDPATISEVARLVKLTATHLPGPADEAGALLCDADLGVLGGTPQEYAAYRLAVRAEYGELDEASWRRGRTAILERLLARQPLFFTPEGRRRWEESARTNLRGELTELLRP